MLIRFIVDISYTLLTLEDLISEFSAFPGAWHDYALFCGAAGLALEFLRWLRKKLDRRLPWALNPMKRFLWQLGIDLPLTLIFSTVLTIVISVGIYQPDPYLAGNWVFIGKQLIFINTTILFVVTALVSVELGGFLVRQWQQSLIDVERFKKDSLEAGFQVLKSQINPHFLFNSLNTVSSLIYVDPDAAATFVRQLSKVYRYVLENREKEIIPLATELSILNAYRYLVETRFQEKLRIDVAIADDERTWYLPPLTLQILIENAIKHNIVAKARPLDIRIFSDAEHYLVVENTLQPKTSTEYSSKIGLKNITARYRYLTDQPVIITETSGVFTVKVPLLSEAKYQETHENFTH